jgi:hypothetical protein
MPLILRLKHEGALLHTGNPVFGKLGRVQKSTRPFDPRQFCRDRIPYLKILLDSRVVYHVDSCLPKFLKDHYLPHLKGCPSHAVHCRN